MRWLLVPGPPMSCYLAYVPPALDPNEQTFYHMHPATWSIHIMLSGSGKHYVEGKGHDVGPGSIIYQGPGVRHSLFPNPDQHLMHVSVQYPSSGETEKDLVICPEAGVADKFGDLQVFIERFGSVDEMRKKAAARKFYNSERWIEYAGKLKLVTGK